MSVSEMTPVRRPERWAPGMAAAGTEAEDEMTDDDIGTGEGGVDDWLLLLLLLLLLVLLLLPVPAVIIVADTAGEVALLLPPLVVVAVVGPEVLCMAAAFPPPLNVLVGAPTGPSSGVAGALGLGLALSTTHIL